MITNITLSDKVYRSLKWFTVLFMPAFGAAYFSLSKIWGLPAAEEVVGTCAVISTFLGALLGVSSKNYNSSDAQYDGELKVETNPTTGKLVYALELNADPSDLREMSKVSFKVIDVDEV